MADIQLEYNIDRLDREVLKERILSAMKELEGKYPFEAEMKDSKIDVRGRGFSGSISFEESTLKLSCKLGLLLKPLKDKIRQEIQRLLERELRSLEEVSR